MAKRGRPRSDAPKAKDWLEKIARAKKVKEAWEEQFRVRMGYDYFEGRQRPAGWPEEDWITVNMIYGLLMAELPTLYSTDPWFYVKLKRSSRPNPMDIARYEAMGKVRQSFLNYLKGELDLKQKARLAIFDAYFRFGMFKVHSTAEIQENPDAGKPIEDEDGFPLSIDGEALVEPDTLPANQQYKYTRIHPDDFLVDEDAGPLNDDVSWKAQRFRVPIEEVRSDLRFGPARKEVKATELSADMRAREQRKKGLADLSKDQREPDTVVYWEVWDLKANQWLVVAEGMEDKFLLEPGPVPVGVDGDPFVDLRWTLRDDSWYPLPPVSQWLDPQREYCESRSKLLAHLKRSKRIVWLNGNAVEDAENTASKMVDGPDLQIITVNPGMGEYPMGVLPDAPLDQQLHMQIAYLRKDFDTLALGANQRGAGGIDSATEAGILEKRAQVREGDKLGLVADFIKTIGRKTDQQVQAHIDQDQAVLISGPQGEVWAEIRTADYEEIDGEYEYGVNVGATTPQLPEIERAQWTAFLGLIASAPQLALSKSLLKKQAELHHIEDEGLIEELHNIAKQMMGGQLPMPGQQGSMPGAPDGMTRPASVSGGMARGGATNMAGGA